jgi:type I restriction enzyme, S subunit
MPKINQAALARVLVAVPPIGEQKRIASRVDELMALCDRLEAAQAERETRRDRVVTASSQWLNPATQAVAFREGARFHLSHLDRFVVTADQVARLRRMILNAAVRGLLVRQESNDQPLVRRLGSRSIEKRVRFADNHSTQIDIMGASRAGQPFSVPISWAWSQPEELSQSLPNALTIGPFGSSLLTSDYTDAGIPLVFVRDIRSEFAAPPRHFVAPAKAAKLRAHSVKPGDLLITKMGDPPGDTAIYPAGRHVGVITADCIKWSIAANIAAVRYLYFALRAPLISAQILEITKGAAHQKVSLKRFRSILIPIPPLSEQHRLVAKIDELMSVCDRLEAQIAAGEAVSSQLLDALLHEALGESATAAAQLQ